MAPTGIWRSEPTRYPMNVRNHPSRFWLSVLVAASSIVAGDEDWSAGSKLVGYKLSDREFNDGANLHLTAELQLSSKKKKAGKTTVTYIVGTSPVITIFRK